MTKKSKSASKAPAKSTGKPLAIIAVGIAAALAVAVFLSRGGTDESAVAAPGGLMADTGETPGRVRGPEDAAVTLVEFGDYQCPTCAAFHPVIHALLERFPQDLKLEFHHMPLVSIHPNALPASIAAEAAGDQGRFWEMNDLLFENQNAWSPLGDPEPAFMAYAERLGLDMDQFAQSLRSQETQARVLADAALARDLGLAGTPTFFVNDTPIGLPPTYPDFERIIYDAIQESTGGKPGAEDSVSP